MKKNTGVAVTATLCGLFIAFDAVASPQIATKAGCAVCHMVDRKLIGPSFKEIAAKYRGKPDALAYLTERVRKGGKGSWGPLPMVPTNAAKISDADLQAVLTWILKTPG
jgi:cytochrome c